MLAKIVHAGTVCPSFLAASTSLDKLADLVIPEKQIERLVRSVGAERVAERDAQTLAYQKLPVVRKFDQPAGVPTPDLAVVMVDGGRLQIRDSADGVARMAEPVRQAERSSSVALASKEESPARAETARIAEPESSVALVSNEATPAVAETAAATLEEATGVLDLDEDELPAKSRHWREDRIGLLLTMKSAVATSDPCPQIPDCFLDPERMRKLARELTRQAKGMVAEDDAPADILALPEGATPAIEYQPPSVLERRVLASRNSWEDFTPIVAEEAWAWGFQKAARKAFVADGAKCNWKLHKRYFSSFTPVLDFIHALSHVYAAALAGQIQELGWACFQKWIGWVWQGQVGLVIAALDERQTILGIPEKGEGATTPRSIVAKTLTYLRNHQNKMDYAAYRRDGLPITSTHVESTVKLINRRVKGSEKFWSEDGAEAILQLRADHLSDHQPLDDFWERRQNAATGLRPYRRAS